MSSYSVKSRRSWQLLAAALVTLRRQPRLVMFPVLTLGAWVLFMLLFLVATFHLPINQRLWHALYHWPTLPEKINHWAGDANLSANSHWSRLGVIYFAVVCLAQFIGVFLNVALYSQVIRALAGDSVSVTGGLRFGLRRGRAILLWSLLAGTVGLLLQKLEERLGLFGKLGLNLVGTVWSVASVFVIPVIIREEDSNPLSLVRKSAATIRNTWGEVLVGSIRIGGVEVLVVMAGSALAIGLAQLVGHTPYDGLIPLIGLVWLLALIAWHCVTSLANDIFIGALYVYATEGVVPEPYTADLMDAAWKVKK